MTHLKTFFLDVLVKFPSQRIKDLKKEEDAVEFIIESFYNQNFFSQKFEIMIIKCTFLL